MSEGPGDRRGASGRTRDRALPGGVRGAVAVAVLAAALALAGAAAAAPPVGAVDDTASTNATRGTSVEVADVEFASTGRVASVRVDLSRGSASNGVEPADVSELKVVLYNESAGALARTTTTYDAQPTEVAVSPTGVTGVDRVRIVATVSSSASDGDTFDAAFVLFDGDGSFEPWQSTAGRQRVLLSTNSFLTVEAEDRQGDPLANATVEIVDLATDTTALAVTTGSDGRTWPLPFAPGEYTATIDDERFDVFATRVRLDAGEAETISVTVERLAPPAPGQDLDGDGRNEDVNGDGSVNVLDVAVLLERFEDSSFQGSAARFDFSGDGRLDILDVAALLAET